MSPTLYFPIEACAGIDNSDAAPAAMRILTLRMGFVPLSGEAAKASLPKSKGR